MVAKIIKPGGAEPDSFEVEIGQALLELELNSELKPQLRDLHITRARSVEVNNKKVSSILPLSNAPGSCVPCLRNLPSLQSSRGADIDATQSTSKWCCKTQFCLRMFLSSFVCGTLVNRYTNIFSIISILYRSCVLCLRNHPSLQSSKRAYSRNQAQNIVYSHQPISMPRESAGRRCSWYNISYYTLELCVFVYCSSSN